MRPVNLIPADQRRSSRAPIRTGPIAYLLVGALVFGVGFVTMFVLTDNKIADHKAEIASLEAQEAAATQRAQQFASFTNFASLEQSRRQTVANLADSRFDWERVMRELSLVIPSNVWLTDLTGSASAGGDAASSSGSSVSGPSLQISGCTVSQDAVAGFLSALRDIDGVTRVGLTSSARPTGAGAGSGASDSAGAGTGADCATKDFIAQFEIQVAFDKAPAPQSATATPAAPTTPASTTPAPAPTTPSTTTPTSTTPTTPAPAPTDTGTEAPASATTP